jgi:hypothetical protein
MRLAGSLVLLVLLVPLALPSSAQQLKRRCTGEAPDSTALKAGPAFRDCEVDRPARLRTMDLPVDFSPPMAGAGGNRCFRAEFQFVVDSTGIPEMATVRSGRSNDRGLEDALRGNLDRLRYEPARLAGRRVRQVVIHSRGIAPVVRVSPDEERTGLPQTVNC